MFESFSKPDYRKSIPGLHRAFRNLCNYRDVFECIKARYKVIELEYEPHMVSSVISKLPFCCLCNVFSFVLNISFRCGIKTPEDIEQCGFTASGGAQQHNDFAWVEFEVNSSERMNLNLSHLIDLFKPLNPEDGLF